MGEVRRVRYLKIDRGRFYYQRRVPLNLQPLLGPRWLIPCGDVSFAKAVQIIVTQAEEHDRLIESLGTEDGRAKFAVEQERAHRAVEEAWIVEKGLTAHKWVQSPTDGELIKVDGNPDFWRSIGPLLMNLDQERAGEIPGSELVAKFYQDVSKARETGDLAQTVIVPDFQFFRSAVGKLRQDGIVVPVEFTGPRPAKMHDLEYLDRLKTLHGFAFGSDSPRPKDGDDLDEYEMLRRKLERRISAVSPASDTISAVLENFMNHNSIREATRRKYRRDTSRLIQLIGDVPVGHIRAEDLRRLRDQEAPKMRPASLHAIFTPIKSMLNYALGNQMIETDPLRGLTLPTDRRTIEERKWRKFDPGQMTRILNAVNEVWDMPVRGLADDRRIAIRMVIRVLAYTAMRPIEVLRLRPEDVDLRPIRIMGSKNEGSDRVIPVHPAIRDFHQFIHGGGMETFRSSKSDPVTPVRHNFEKLIREKLDPAVTDPKQVLYSLRSTFQNAMRRAGAPVDVRRAILGHKEAGALRHYDDGPEFELKMHLVKKTDPRRPYESSTDGDDEEGDLE